VEDVSTRVTRTGTGTKTKKQHIDKKKPMSLDSRVGEEFLEKMDVEELRKTFESGLLEVVKRFMVPDMSLPYDYVEWLKNEIKSKVGVEPYELVVYGHARLPREGRAEISAEFKVGDKKVSCVIRMPMKLMHFHVGVTPEKPVILSPELPEELLKPARKFSAFTMGWIREQATVECYVTQL
jgi:hypothetical protein